MHITISIPFIWLTALGLPEHLCSDASDAADIVKTALLRVLSQPITDEAHLQLKDPPAEVSGPSARMTIPLANGPSSVLMGLSKAINLTPGPMAKRLIGLTVAGALELPPADSADREVPKDHEMAVLNSLLHPGTLPRSAQVQFYDNLWTSVKSFDVGLVEGGTGIGKTRAMISAAARRVLEQESSVGICAPSLILLRQFADEYKKQSVVTDLPPLRLFVGRREFVDESALTTFLDTTGKAWDSPEVREWLLDGGGLNDDDPTDLSWQVHSLQAISPDIPVDEFRLDEGCSVADRGYVAYRAQFFKGDETAPMVPSILLFTHAMLAQDMRRRLIVAGQDETYQAMQKFYVEICRKLKGKSRAKDVQNDDVDALHILEAEMGVALQLASDNKGILPKFRSLMVDEGHTLDESFGSALSDYVSLSAVLRDMREFTNAGGGMPAGTIEEVDTAIKKLIVNAPCVDKRDFVSLSSDTDNRLSAQIGAVATACESLSKPRDQSSDKFRLYMAIRRAGILINSAITTQRNSSLLRHSPMRHLPQLIVSTANSKTLMSRLWSSLESAAVVSATLYLPTKEGGSGGFMSGLLQIPANRLLTFIPVEAPWTKQCVKGVWVAQADPVANPFWLHPPSQKIPFSKLSRTKEEFDLAESTWHSELATEITKIWDSAEGGVMVLCTSYTTVNALKALLSDRSERIVSAAPKVAIRTQSGAFMKLTLESREGLKPLWLAVGGAWTGVDIGGHDPWREKYGTELAAEEDNVLTDLVIPRLPFGVNQSLPHLWRLRNSPTVPWDLLDAALRFKQALGRLVRRDKLPRNRRIHILDSRLGDEQRASQLIPFSKALSKYKMENIYPNLK